MLGKTMKALLFLATLAACLYGMQVFGPSPWPLAAVLAVSVVAASIFVPRLNLAARIIGHVVGVLSALSLLLLLLAATIGGSFHLSASNEVIAMLLLSMASFGLSSFFWPSSTGGKEEPRPDPASGIRRPEDPGA